MQKLTFATLDFNAQNTPVSTVFDDIYFSSQDGLAESYYVFQEGNQLWERWLACQQAAFVIAETGFGTGLNFLAVAEKFQEFCQAYPNNPLKISAYFGAISSNTSILSAILSAFRKVG